MTLSLPCFCAGINCGHGMFETQRGETERKAGSCAELLRLEAA